MANKVTVSAPGKLILSGEHSVVYGYPALLTAINRRCWVKVEPISKPEIKISDQQFGTETISLPKLEQFAREAQRAWEEFDRTNQITQLRGIKKDALGLAKLAIAAALREVKKPMGVRVTIRSQIPIGSGMGSSAALSVAIIGAALQLSSGTFDKERINRLAFEVEKKIHGRPSGGDNTIVTFGGIIQFQKGKPPKPVKEQSLGPAFLVIQTGSPQETTGEMVSLVRDKLDNSALQQKTKQTLQSMGEVTRKFVNAFKNHNQRQLHQLMIKNEQLLEQLGVVSDRAQSLIRQLEKQGMAAKICGAGGIKKNSGVVLVLTEDENIAPPVLQREGLDYSQVMINQRGVNVENT